MPQGQKVLDLKPQEPSVESLREKALTYLEENKPQSLAQMRRDKELEKYLDLVVRACQRYARNLMEQGMGESEAWNLAIRQEILESESD